MTVNIHATATVQAPSRKQIAAAAATALVVAVVVLVATVLPAEYGKDPFGAVKPLGLLDMYEASADTAPSPAPATPSTAGARARNVDSSEFNLGPHQAFEYKYHTETGASMVYAWKTTSA